MSYISIDPKTYRRLEQFARRDGVSIHAAASNAVENWLDITADPRLAITALTTIALTQPLPDSALALPDLALPALSQPHPSAPALPPVLPPNVTFINANLGASPNHRNDSLHKLAEASALTQANTITDPNPIEDTDTNTDTIEELAR